MKMLNGDKVKLREKTFQEAYFEYGKVLNLEQIP
jgi:hypothetical protein